MPWLIAAVLAVLLVAQSGVVLVLWARCRDLASKYEALARMYAARVNDAKAGLSYHPTGEE